VKYLHGVLLRQRHEFDSLGGAVAPYRPRA
jgi:hypothetical protein